MLSKNDMKELRGMMREVVEENNGVLQREIRDEFHSVLTGEIAASERRMIQRMDEGFQAITDLIDDGILPQVEEHDREIRKIKHRLKLA